MTILLRKISIKNVVGKQRKPEKTRALMRVYGTATGVQTGYSDQINREWSALTGSFEAINLETGEVFASPKAFIPDPVGSMLMAAVAQNTGVGIDFAVEVSIKPTETSIGYEYVVKSLIEPKSDAKLVAMREQFIPSALLTHESAASAPKQAPVRSRKA